MGSSGIHSCMASAPIASANELATIAAQRVALERARTAETARKVTNTSTPRHANSSAPSALCPPADVP